MKVLTVPNWSFGRDNGLIRRMVDLLEERPVEIHYLKGDVDHNRTVSAFSGEREAVADALLELCEMVLPSIDLNRHSGCHPRIGGLDVCPFIPFEQPDKDEFNQWVDSVAERVASEFELPIFLYEHSEKGRHASQLPALRKGGFGSLLAAELDPDFGPRQAHPMLGATVMGWRDFLIAMNLNLKEERPYAAETLARKVRGLRRDGDPRFVGVRALGFALPSRGMSQLSMNFTKPNQTYVDEILTWAFEAADRAGVVPDEPELIGVIRPRDLEHGMLISYEPNQVVDMR